MDVRKGMNVKEVVHLGWSWMDVLEARGGGNSVWGIRLWSQVTRANYGPPKESTDLN